MFGSGCSFWPTPTAQDAGYFPDLVLESGQITFTGPHDRTEGSAGQFSLANAARIWTMLRQTLQALGATPSTARRLSSLPVRVSFKHGIGSSPAGLISNPPFYEMAMGWPIGWTDARAPVTGFAVWLQRSRGALSEALALQAEDDPALLSDPHGTTAET